MSFDVRPATEGDYEQVCMLFDELDEFHRIARPEFFKKPEGEVRSRDDLARLLDGEGRTILVAESPERLVGLAVVLLRRPSTNPLLVRRCVVEIDNIVVHRWARRQGVGRSLVAASVDWASEHGADHVEIAVHHFNQGAIRFYEALGFGMSVHRLLRRLK
jgi:diamine N-acetyltransferase